MSFFVNQHNYQIKSFILRKNIMGKVQCLLKAQEKHLILGKPKKKEKEEKGRKRRKAKRITLQQRSTKPNQAAIRFFRSIIGQKDDTFLGHMIQNKLFEPLFKVFEAHKRRYNLINSALLDLFEFVKQVLFFFLLFSFFLSFFLLILIPTSK